MNEEVNGIVLHETVFGESSKILQILTLEHGLIGAIAKNALNIRSTMRNKAVKFSIAKFNIIYKENKLSTIVSIDILNNLTTLKSDIILIGYLTYLCDLTYQVLKNNNEPSIYHILVPGLLKMNANLDPLVLTNIIELKYLKYLGVSLNLDSCSICGTKQSILTLSVEDSGYICKNCYHNEYIVNPKTITMIRKYLYVDISSITSLNISNEVKLDINMFLTRYYDTYTGLYLKSKNFLNKMLELK